MSRVAKKPIEVPNGVDVMIEDESIKVKGAKGSGALPIPKDVTVVKDGKALTFASASVQGWALAGTLRAQVMNLVNGVSKGFEKKLELVGVGYRAQMQGGKKLNIALGYAHPIEYAVPEGISIETPSQTEMLIKGVDRQRVGQVAAEIRNFRPPEPYKGKGVKYANETLIRKEAKKK
jgi:large subunit ribosomal protein L6